MNTESIQSVGLDDADFDKMCDEFGFLELIKIACQTNGIGNNYFKKKKELKEKYWQAKQQQIVPELDEKTLERVGWEAWEKESKKSPTEINPHAFFLGYKSAYKAALQKQIK